MVKRLNESVYKRKENRSLMRSIVLIFTTIISVLKSKQIHQKQMKHYGRDLGGKISVDDLSDCTIESLSQKYVYIGILCKNSLAFLDLSHDEYWVQNGLNELKKREIVFSVTFGNLGEHNRNEFRQVSLYKLLC